MLLDGLSRSAQETINSSFLERELAHRLEWKLLSFFTFSLFSTTCIFYFSKQFEALKGDKNIKELNNTSISAFNHH